jgi:hypothetical protein
MADYPPTFEELVEQLGEVVRLAERLPPDLQGACEGLAEIYEKVRRAQQRQEKIDPE